MLPFPPSRCYRPELSPHPPPLSTSERPRTPGPAGNTHPGSLCLRDAGSPCPFPGEGGKDFLQQRLEK